MKDVLKTIENDLLYKKKKIVIPGNNTNRRAHYTNIPNTVHRKDENLTDIIPKL